MEFLSHSHRHADIIIPHESPAESAELIEIMKSISDEDIISRFEADPASGKSISKAVNFLLDERLKAAGWLPQAAIFQDDDYQDQRWRLDFAKGLLSVEVAFNHGEAIAWNLLKPILASEYNHVRKAIQTRFGIVICATDAMKDAGGFDGAVGSFEKFVRYLKPLQQVLSVPVMLYGLSAPKTFRIRLENREGRKYGVVERF